MTDDHSYSVESASKQGNEDTPAGFDRFDDVIMEFMLEQSIPGIGLAVSYHGNLIYSQGYGTAGVGRRVRSSSRFRIASISKTLTAVGVLRLVEEGRLTLEAKVFGHKGILTELRPSSKGDKRVLQITVRHLLQHSAGWDRDQAGDPVFFNLDAIAPKEGVISPISSAFNVKLVKFMMSKKLQFSPGKRHAYSNFGYLILGMVLERVTLEDYCTYMSGVVCSLRLPRLRVGFTKRVLCDVDEVEYFNNREPALHKSIFSTEGHVLPQYGSFSMENTGSYGGWVASPCELLQCLHALHTSREESYGDVEQRTPNISGTFQLESQWRQVPREHSNRESRSNTDKRLYTSHPTMNTLPESATERKEMSAKKRKFDSNSNRKVKYTSKHDLNRMELDIIFDKDISCAEVEIPSSEILCGDDVCGAWLGYQSYTSFGIPIERTVYRFESSSCNDGVCLIQNETTHFHGQMAVPRPSHGCHRVLQPHSLSVMLTRPQYEHGSEWYGLGLDVQDCGSTFGHTGAMEGSCGTMMHHTSGFSWVMLMNAWSRDMDLDGLVKYALSTVNGYPLYFPMQMGSDIYEISSQDGDEKVRLLVPHSEVVGRVTEAKTSGFVPIWMNACEVNSTLVFSWILRKKRANWRICMDIKSIEIEQVISNSHDNNYHPVFIESYSFCEQIHHCVIFEHNQNIERQRIVISSVSLEAFLKLKSDMESAHRRVICQCVSSHKGQCYASAIFRDSDDVVVSWLQISAEEFLMEQKKQLTKGKGLQYVKFYSLGDDPFVSGLWSDACPATDRLQRYGASKYGLLHELRAAYVKNRRLQSCSVYVSEGVLNFAVVWDSLS